jgi:hypothetical protein
MRKNYFVNLKYFSQKKKYLVTSLKINILRIIMARERII